MAVPPAAAAAGAAAAALAKALAEANEAESAPLAFGSRICNGGITGFSGVFVGIGQKNKWRCLEAFW
jgi:hypothetical protein